MPAVPVQVSLDLARLSAVYLDFLARFQARPELDHDLVLKRAVRRYEHCWLPLVAEWKTPDLDAPPDVQWVWTLHMLTPSDYEAYCTKHFKKVVPHRFRVSQGDEKQAMERARPVWNDRYPEEPYDLDLNKPQSSLLTDNASGLCGVIERSDKERRFLYQVSLPHYRDTTFIKEALKRYQQFIVLCQQREEFLINPPVDIQIIWKCHILHPVEYQRDCEKSLQRTLDYHGDVTQLDGYIFVLGSSSDAEIWKNAFNDVLFKPGTGNRGTDSKGVLHQVSNSSLKLAPINSCELQINDLVVENLWTKDTDLTIEARRLGTSSAVYTTIFQQPAKVGTPLSSLNQEGLGSMQFDPNMHKGVEFHIYGQRRVGCLGCFRQEEHITTVFFSPTLAFQNQPFYTREWTVDIPKVTYTDPKFTFSCRVKAGDSKPSSYSLDREAFQTSKLPDDLAPFVKSQASWDYVLMLNKHQEFSQATHTVRSRELEQQMSCKVIKADDFDLLAVLLYHNGDTLVCAAHSVGVEQLPNPMQVSGNCPLTLDPVCGEHAMLVRNHAGDSAFCLARWRQKPNSVDGEVLFRVFWPHTNHQTEFKVRDDELESIVVDDMKINMPTGRITLQASCRQVAESLTLAYCIGMLFVTCQRRASQAAMTSGGSVRSSKSETTLIDSMHYNSAGGGTAGKVGFARLTAKMRQKKRTVRRKMSASFTFLLACGLSMEDFVHGSTTSTRRSTSVPHLPGFIDPTDPLSLTATEANSTSSRPSSASLETSGSSSDIIHMKDIPPVLAEEVISEETKDEVEESEYMDIRL